MFTSLDRGRYIKTLRRTSDGNYYTFCNIKVPNSGDFTADLNGDGKVDAKEAEAWQVPAWYATQLCTLPCESTAWAGDEVDTFKEFKDVCGVDRPHGTLFGGNHYDTSCGTPGSVCDWLELLP